MFARERLSFQPPRLSTYQPDSLSPIIPTLARPSRKSNHSRTYGIPRGGGGYRFFCQTNLSRSFYGNPALCPLLFQTLAYSFNFRITPIRCILRSMRTLAQETGGYPRQVIPISPSPISHARTIFHQSPSTGYSSASVPTFPRPASTFTSNMSYTPTEVNPK